LKVAQENRSGTHYHQANKANQRASREKEHEVESEGVRLRFALVPCICAYGALAREEDVEEEGGIGHRFWDGQTGTSHIEHWKGGRINGSNGKGFPSVIVSHGFFKD
jgi:hypothetical protein